MFNSERTFEFIAIYDSFITIEKETVQVLQLHYYKRFCQLAPIKFYALFIHIFIHLNS